MPGQALKILVPVPFEDGAHPQKGTGTKVAEVTNDLEVNYENFFETSQWALS